MLQLMEENKDQALKRVIHKVPYWMLALVAVSAASLGPAGQSLV